MTPPTVRIVIDLPLDASTLRIVRQLVIALTHKILSYDVTVKPQE